MKHILAVALLVSLTACETTKQAEAPDAAALSARQAETSEAAKANKSESNAPLTETATPNKAASDTQAQMDGDDLESLKAQLNALNADISKMRGTLVEPQAEVAIAKTTLPDTQQSTPRALVTDGVVSIPDSKPELEAAKDRASVQGVRVGAHEDKTRLVLDIDRVRGGTPPVSIDGNLLKIRLFETKWERWDTQTSSLGSSLGVFNVSEEGRDTVVTVTLAGKATVKSATVLPPASPGGPSRLVIDLAPAS